MWEPILFTDWGPPGSGALARIADPRARQFWDPQHVVSRALSRAATRRPAVQGPSCCLHDGLHWDEAVLYPSGPLWHEAPAPVFWNGAVAHVAPRLGEALEAVTPSHT